MPAPAAVVWLHGIQAEGREDLETGEMLLRHGRIHVDPTLMEQIEFVFPALTVTGRPNHKDFEATMWYRHLLREQDGHPPCYVAEPMGFVQAAARVVRVIEELVEKGIPPHRIVLGGWCQGACLALAVLLFLEKVTIGGYVGVSGYTPMMETLRSWVEAHGGPGRLRNRHVPVHTINWRPDTYIGEEAMSASVRFFRTEMAFTRWGHTEYPEAGHEMTDGAWASVWEFILQVLER